MKRRLLVWGAACLGVILLTVIQQFQSLNRQGLERDEVTASRPTTEILVGVSWPFALAHDGMAEGLQLARDEIQAAGGPAIRLVLRDDQNDWDVARRIALDFAATPQMTAVLGYRDDSLALRASGIYARARMLHLVVGSTVTSLTKQNNPYLLRTLQSGEDTAIQISSRVASPHSGPPLRYALLWSTDPHSSELAYHYQIAQNKAGAELVFQKNYSRDMADFRQAINELRGSPADLVYFIGTPEQAGHFLQMARRMGVRKEVALITRGLNEVRNRAGAEGMINLTYLEFYDPAAPSPVNQAFVSAFKARFGKEPDTWAAQGYDALHLLANGVKDSLSVNPMDVAYAIRYAPPREGANGLYAFDKNGEILSKPVYLRHLDETGALQRN